MHAHMNYQLLGRSGLRVSDLCLGTMTFGEEWGWGAAKSEAQKIYDAFGSTGASGVQQALGEKHEVQTVGFECLSKELAVDSSPRIMCFYSADVRETPLHSLETDSSVKLASSRGKPVDNRSGIGLNEREGIAVRRKVSIKINRFARRGQTQRHATISVDREGALDQEPLDDCTSE
jgi:hypothetical protein